jgi:cyclopropane fatty-acyl-phospholipid synthase-like methyltransferase
VDIFGHGSLSDASLEKAGANMKALGIEPRVELRRHDLRKPLDSDGTYDMAISNLVFHNLGKKRYLAYETVFNALKDGGYFILGDLFPSLIEDVEFFNGRCSIVSEKVSEGSGKWAYRILLLQKKQNE